MMEAQTIVDRFDDFSDFVFISLSSPVEFLTMLDLLATAGFYLERNSPVTISVRRSTNVGLVKRLHHLDYSTDHGFEWVKVIRRLDQMGLDRPETLILNNMTSTLPDFKLEATLLESMVPCLSQVS